MQAEQARIADTAAWLAKAHLDLRSAEHPLTAPPPFARAVFAAILELLPAETHPKAR